MLDDKYSYDLGGCQIDLIDEDMQHFKLALSIYNRKEFDYNTLNIICKDVPALEENCTSDLKVLYNEIKEELYEFLPYIYQYVKYLSKIKSNISIGENTYINIDDSTIKFKNYGLVVGINFSNLALLEIKIENGNIHLITFSKDMEVKKYLDKKGESILDEIFIYDEKVDKLLKIIEV